MGGDFGFWDPQYSMRRAAYGYLNVIVMRERLNGKSREAIAEAWGALRAACLVVQKRKRNYVTPSQSDI